MKKHNKGDLVKVNRYNVWSVTTPKQKSMFMDYNILAVILDESTSYYYKVYVLDDDSIQLIHKDDIKCIES